MPEPSQQFPPSRARVVVYDGIGLSGRLTNLTAILRALPAQQRSELSSTVSADEDGALCSAEVRSGRRVLDGEPLVVRLIAPHGAAGAPMTRRAWLARADAVVLVVDAAESRRAATEVWWREVQGWIDPATPRVVQLNKRDLPDAMSWAALRAALGAPGNVVAVEASALYGIGVRETLDAVADVLAARAPP